MKEIVFICQKCNHRYGFPVNNDGEWLRVVQNLAAIKQHTCGQCNSEMSIVELAHNSRRIQQIIDEVSAIINDTFEDEDGRRKVWQNLKDDMINAKSSGGF